MLRSLRGAMNALRERDAELADEVIAFDDEVDARYLALEQGIESLLARQTPVAVDLRLVLAILHCNLHLERMADLCVTISKLTKLAGAFEGDAQVLESFDEMGLRAEEMVGVAMRALAERDLAGRRVARRARRADRPRQPPARPARAGGRRRRGEARVGAADDRHLPLPRALRRPHGRHRRAGRVPRHGRAARVLGRVARRTSSRPTVNRLRHQKATGRTTTAAPHGARLASERIHHESEAFDMRFRRTAGLLATVVVGAAVLAGTVSAGGSVLSGTITADGSSTLGPYVTAAAEAFQKKYPADARHRRHRGHGRRLHALLQGRDRHRQRITEDQAGADRGGGLQEQRHFLHRLRSGERRHLDRRQPAEHLGSRA